MNGRKQEAQPHCEVYLPDFTSFIFNPFSRAEVAAAL